MHTAIRSGCNPKNRLRSDEYTRPPPPHRHSGPSAPWPWINLNDEVDAAQLSSKLPPIPEPCSHIGCGGCWKGYPQSRFPNWTPSQVWRSGIHQAITENNSKPCKIYAADIDKNGYFMDAGERTVEQGEESAEEYWVNMIREKRPDNLQVRALFVENMSGSVLRMLGAQYNIEPFFFSSSLSWIPSRFQEEVKPRKGDHITITLIFLRTMDTFLSGSSGDSSTCTENSTSDDAIINTQAPLFLSSGDGCYLVLDLLAVHLIRNVEGNTIISYHHNGPDATSAQYLHERIRFAGQSVYWQNIFQRSPDPTFVLLTFIWHAMYAWDEALETLYKHICWMETQVMTTSDMLITRRLHIIRAHHLHYSSLLEDFRKAVLFILNTPNPAMDSLPDKDRLNSQSLLVKECNHLLSEIDRLERGRRMQDKRLKNVMHLVFSTVNIGDSRRMQDLTEAAVRDSAAMKQIAYLSMIFLPASLVAGVFGMNVHEIAPDTKQSLPHYFAVALPLTAATIWLVMTFQSKYLFGKKDTTFWQRLAWPWLLFKDRFGLDECGESERLPLSRPDTKDE
ncbi:hypothetical protein E1B28_013426 [Marasmius oreades]|uniref:Uncharacterized protein n=1 Tax=Marasmius oreades TaxID=181124 RepID=A0A9P7RQJ2_9AGAR|nr:uncharacterized protein E1B28_013426 [Marasmius oreades]KAG7087460.1 hypothetical protein E1B28_013426 [Marasmius oreades]